MANAPRDPRDRRIPWWRRWRALVVGAFSVVVLAVGASEYLSVQRAFSEAERTAIRSQRDTALALASATRLFIERYESIAEQAAAVVFGLRLEGRALDRFVASLLEIHPDIGTAVVTGPTGETVSVADPRQRGVNLAHRPYFRELRDGARVVVSDLLRSPTLRRPATPVAAAGRAPGGRFLGVVVIGLPAERLAERLTPNLADGAYPIVLDRRGQVIVHGGRPDLPWEARDFSGVPAVQAAARGEAVASAEIPDPAMGATRVGAIVPIQALGWSVGVLQPVETAFAAARAQRARSLATLGVLTAVALALAALLGLWLSAPVAALSSGLAALARGELTHRVRVRGPGEMSRLGADFNDMAEALLSANEELKANAVQMEESLGELEVANQSLDEALVRAQTDRQRLEVTLDSLPDAALVVDGEGRVVIANDPLRRLLGDIYRPGFWIFTEDRPPLVPHLLRGEPVPPEALPLRRALRYGERTLDLRLGIVAPSGQLRQVAVAATPIVGQDGRSFGAVTVMRDVTEAHLLETLKDQFIARASHELRTPVTAIRGTLRFLARALAGRSDERPDELVAIAERNVEHMIRLIDDLLDASRLSSGHVPMVEERVPLADLVEQVAQQFLATAREKRIALETRVDPGLVLDAADPLKIEQVLTNLVTNALKFTPAGGRVTIAARESAGEVEIRVQDTGDGLAAEHLSRVFDPFFQVGLPARRGGRSLGAGLGLTIAKGLVELHRGRLWVESEGLGRGATFIVVLPRRRED